MDYSARRRRRFSQSNQRSIEINHHQTNWRYVTILIAIALIVDVSILAGANHITKEYDSFSKLQESITQSPVQYVRLTKNDAPILLATNDPFRPGGIWNYVSHQHELPANFKPSALVSVPIATGGNLPMRVMPIVARALTKMNTAATADGIHLVVVSAYRSNQDQHVLYTESVAQYGEVYARNHVAQPHQSEHATGLAVDINTNSTECQQDAALCNIDQPTGEWLASNAPRFGFILRYPPGKSSITGIASEPWHFRFVGDGAVSLSNSGLTLDEFVNYIKSTTSTH